MPTTYLYLKNESYAKLVYIQEQRNKGQPLEEQKTVSQIMREWIEARLELEEVKPTIDNLTKED